MNKITLTIVGVFILIVSSIGCKQAEPTVNYEKIDKLKAEATAQKQEERKKAQSEADALQTKWAETSNKANDLRDKAIDKMGTEEYDKINQEVQKLDSEADRYYSEYRKKMDEVNRLDREIQQIEKKIEADNK